MEKRKMEKIGIETSLLGFGCMRFPLTADGKIDEPLAEEMLDKAIAAGVNYIDTAYPYHDGASEPFVGRVLKKYDRSSFYLATKMPPWAVQNIDDVKKVFATQLERLQTDYVDFYLLHAMNKTDWKKMKDLGVIEYCEELKKEGKIRNFGFSFHDDYETFEEIITYRAWDFCQIQLNYMDMDEQAGRKGYELTEKLGIPLVIMEPVRGGSLAKFSDDINAKFAAMDPEASIASFALRFVGSMPNVKVVLSGMSSMEQVEDNLKTFGDFKPLTEAEQAGVADIVNTLRSRVVSPCTGCRYCMPCPAGVDIPANFSAWNNLHMYQSYDVVSWAWENNIGEKCQAKNCIECGKCEAICPQHIHIREDLKKVQEEMDNKGF